MGRMQPTTGEGEKGRRSVSQVRKLGEMYVGHPYCPNVRPIFVSTYHADSNGPSCQWIAIAAGDDDDGARARALALPFIALAKRCSRQGGKKVFVVDSPQLCHGGFAGCNSLPYFDTFRELRAQCYIHP